MLDDVWVVVPTAGRATLEPAIDSTGVPRERIVIVHTGRNVTLLQDTISVLDHGEINIHRWWNAGLDAVAARGGRYALVINDDVLLSAETVAGLLSAMQETGATLASPGGGGLCTDPGRTSRRIDGACWLLDLTHGLRPDEGYRWWFGDDDLDWRARRDHAGIVSVSCYFEHLHPNHLTSTTPELEALTLTDAARWHST